MMKKNEIMEMIKKGFYSKSPYSDSFYITNTYEGLENISWNSKPNKSLRIADHWNFWSMGENHCILKHTKIYSQELLVAIYDEETQEYEMLLSGEEAKEVKKFLINIIEEKNRIQREIRDKIIEKRIKEKKKAERKYLKEFLLKLPKNKKDKENVLKLIKEKQIYTTKSSNKRYSETPEYKLFKKYEFLFKNSKWENDSPRGGKLGEKIVLNKKDINKIMEALGE